MPDIKLAPEKNKWIKNRTVALKGNKLNYNASLQLKYQQSIRRLTRDMIKETKEKILKLFQTNNSENFFKQRKKAEATDESITSKSKKVMNSLMSKFTQLFSLAATPAAKDMLNGTKKYSESSLRSSVKKLTGGLSLETGVVPKGMEEVSQAIIDENVSLIKSIPQEYLGKVSGAVMRSITTGNGLADLVPEIQKYSGETDRRAKNIALDQTRKAYNAINKERMQKLGIKKFRWIHTGGGQHPRKSHQEISGNIYSFDNLPLKGQEGFVNGVIPGQAINCRCTMEPIIEFENGVQI